MARGPKLTSDIPSHAEKERKARKRRRTEQQAIKAFEGKVFADLTSEEKDTILRLLAVRAGFVEE